MPPKHPYTDEACKGAFLSHLDNGDSIPTAAKKAKINTYTARDIKARSDNFVNFCNNYNLPPPSLHNRVAIKPKSGRPYILSEISRNILKTACKQDRHYRKMFQFDVAQELNIKASCTTIQREIKTQRLNQVKPTKKLALTEIQQVQQYKIVLLYKDWTLDNWKKVVFTDKAAILVREYCSQYKILYIPEDRYNLDCIEVRYNNYSKTMFWGLFLYNYKGPCYIYYTETAAKKLIYQGIIDCYNAILLLQKQAE
jgi:hypothetical protein